MHDVTPNVVPSAVRIDIRICTINFQVSFFIPFTSYSGNARYIVIPTSYF